MRKIYVALLVTMMLTISALCMSPVHAETSDADTINTSVKLSDQQKVELADLNKDILEKKKQVITKYVEFGVISEKKGKIMMTRMDKYYAKLKQDGFIPNWDNKYEKHKQYKQD